MTQGGPAAALVNLTLTDLRRHRWSMRSLYRLLFASLLSVFALACDPEEAEMQRTVGCTGCHLQLQ